MTKNVTVMGDLFVKDVLSGTQVILPMNNAPLPCTVTLKSSAAGRKIELSTDGGVEYFTPTVDVGSSATMQIVTVTAPISHVKFTGIAGDAYRVQ